MVKRHAFTMIELIFAIVVIAITVVSLPMMIQVNFKGIEGNVKQEAIFASSAKLMQVLSFAWDKNTTDMNLSKSLDYARVMDILGTTNYLRKDLANVDDNSSVFRIGHIRQGLHRRFFDSNDTIVPGAGIEDQAGTTELVAIDKDGYKYNMQLSTVVSNVSDTIPSPATSFSFPITNSGNSNIKLITITTTIDGNGDGDYNDANNIDSQIVLRAYATNIGEIDFNKRRY